MPPSADAISHWQVSSDRVTWMPARVPGTVAGALGDRERDYDAEDWWFRARLDVAPPADDEEVLLRLEGIATIADVYLDGSLVVESNSMFTSHTVDLGRRGYDEAEILICCRALAPVLAEARSPRARWRPRIAPSGLRHVRTMILGRAPGFAPGPAAVGPWRPVTVERRRHVALDDFVLRTRVTGDDGQLRFSGALRPLGTNRIRSASVVLSGPTGTHQAPLRDGQLTVPRVARWWPHTHGDPVLHDVKLLVETGNDEVEVATRRVGFRTLESAPNVEEDGIGLCVNGQSVFARGAVWTPIDLVTMTPSEKQLRVVLERVRDGGMNMLRIPGTSAYESATFHDLCDELGLMVWQDFMFANFDYPIDDAFRSAVESEARAVLEHVAWRPSLAVVCGNSEVEQQATMLGRSVDEARSDLFGDLLPRLVRDADIDAPYVPSAPCGGDLPFRPGVGIANYYGVGGYRRPFSDVRLAGVRFAAECLAFSNLPDDDELAGAGVPADVGSDWDFADTRNHYAVALYGSDASARLEVGRATSGEVMAEVFGEWRRDASPCRGGLVLWLTDVRPGAGWGVLDHRGDPKVAYHHLRRALAPVAVWMTDEGQGGLDLHVANDRPTPLSTRLRVAFYRDREIKVEEAEVSADVPAHTVKRWGVEEMLGRFIDASYAYRFGPAGFDVVVASLESDNNLLSQAFRFPVGRPRGVDTAASLGLVCDVRKNGDSVVLDIGCRRLAHGVRVHMPGFEANDNAFSIEPGSTRSIALQRVSDMVASGSGLITAVNLADSVAFDVDEST
ncbi:MAG: beta-mannosidase [Acidimicrobiaceae bacterium]|jgi:beta-mannosidase